MKSQRLMMITAPLVISLVSLSLSAGEGQIRRSPKAVPGEYIVVLNDDTPRDSVPGIVHQLVAQHGGSAQHVWQDALKGYSVKMTEGQANGLSHNPKVKYVEENAEMFLSTEIPTKVDPTCNPPSSCPVSDNRLWHLDRLDQNGAAPNNFYDYCDDGTGAYVYVIDTGVMRSHREFNNDPNRVLNGYNAADDAVPADSGLYYPAYDQCHGAQLGGNDHGTGVGSMVNGLNVGVARGAKIVPVKVFNCGDIHAPNFNVTTPYERGQIVHYNAHSYVCYTAGTSGSTAPVPTYADSLCANSSDMHPEGMHSGTACFDYRGDHTSEQTVEMTIEGVDWILRPPNPNNPPVQPANTNPVAHQVATFSHYRMASGPVADAATQKTIDNRLISFEEAILNLIKAGVTVIASANNQNANACDTSPARLSRNSPIRPASGDPNYGFYTVITAGGTMLANNPDGPTAADGGTSVHAFEPDFNAAHPIQDVRWICTAGDSDVCSAAQPASGDVNESAYSHKTFGSNAGQCVTLFAPAKNIPVAAFASGLAYRDTGAGTLGASGGGASGTSWSAPIVAGVVARILGSHPTYSVEDVYTELMTNYTTNTLVDSPAYPLNPPGLSGTPTAVLHTPDVLISALPTNISGSYTASATGSAPLIYQWYQVDPAFDVATYHTGAAALTPVGGNSATLSSPVGGTSYFLRVKSSCGSADSNITTALVQAPSNVVAAAVSTTSVQLSWTGVSGATSYEVSRTSNASAYTVVGTSTASPFTDITAAPGVAYIYKVKSVDSGGNKSAFSIGDLATTIFFTDDPIVSYSTPAQAVHLTQLRTAVDAVRMLAGLGGGSYTDPSPYRLLVNASHITELRSALNAARSTLQLPALSYTDPTITIYVTTIKAAHVQELRDGVK